MVKNFDYTTEYEEYVEYIIKCYLYIKNTAKQRNITLHFPPIKLIESLPFHKFENFLYPSITYTDYGNIVFYYKTDNLYIRYEICENSLNNFKIWKINNNTLRIKTYKPTYKNLVKIYKKMIKKVEKSKFTRDEWKKIVNNF